MLRSIKSTQREMRQLELIVDGTGTAALSGPAVHQASLVDNGAGDYTITFDQAYAAIPVCIAVPVTTGVICRIKAASSSAVNVECLDVETGLVATDADFHLLVIGSDVADSY